MKTKKTTTKNVTTYSFMLQGTETSVNFEITPKNEIENLNSFLVGNIIHRIKVLASHKAIRFFKRSENLQVIFKADNIELNTGKLATELCVNLKSGKSQIDTGKLSDNLKAVIEVGLLMADNTDYSIK